MKSKKKVVPLSADKSYGADHHIWDNNGSWWAHFSIRRPRGHSQRVRVSLCTKSRKLARQRRDALFKTPPEKIPALVKKWRSLRDD